MGVFFFFFLFFFFFFFFFVCFFFFCNSNLIVLVDSFIAAKMRKLFVRRSSYLYLLLFSDVLFGVVSLVEGSFCPQ